MFVYRKCPITDESPNALCVPSTQAFDLQPFAHDFWVSNYPIVPGTKFVKDMQSGDVYENVCNLLYFKLLPFTHVFGNADDRSKIVKGFIEDYFQDCKQAPVFITVTCVSINSIQQRCPSHLGYLVYGFDNAMAKGFIEYCNTKILFRTSLNGISGSPTVRMLCEPDGSLDITNHLDSSGRMAMPANVSEVGLYVCPIYDPDGKRVTQSSTAFWAWSRFCNDHLHLSNHGLHFYILPQKPMHSDIALIAHGFTLLEAIEAQMVLKENFGDDITCTIRLMDKGNNMLTPTALAYRSFDDNRSYTHTLNTLAHRPSSPTPSNSTDRSMCSTYDAKFPALSSSSNSARQRLEKQQNEPSNCSVYKRVTPATKDNAWFKPSTPPKSVSMFAKEVPKPVSHDVNNYMATYDTGHPDNGKVEVYKNGSLAHITYESPHKEAGKTEFYELDGIVACTYTDPHLKAQKGECKEYYNKDGTIDCTEIFDPRTMKMVEKIFPNGRSIFPQ